MLHLVLRRSNRSKYPLIHVVIEFLLSMANAANILSINYSILYTHDAREKFGPSDHANVDMSIISVLV